MNKGLVFLKYLLYVGPVTVNDGATYLMFKPGDKIPEEFNEYISISSEEYEKRIFKSYYFCKEKIRPSSISISSSRKMKKYYLLQDNISLSDFMNLAEKFSNVTIEIMSQRIVLNLIRKKEL